MNEYWIVYDVATGDERWRGSGSIGTSLHQQLPEGFALVLVPMAVVANAVIDLGTLRAAMAQRIDVEAERVRMSVLTSGSGQAMTYQRKEAEARAWTDDATTQTPFLSAEADARGMAIADLAAEVIQNADVWTTIGAAIEGLRMGAKAAVGRAVNLGAIVAASKADWSVLNA
ncbi:hypothetical protein U1707_14285 [Sphingomonas sp. PB2P12]|uniref:hypothetical protein n=1 Tax=Sphingomonas sandaracina TaxID=3096157 RepID=UPI002FC5BFC9